MGQISDCGASIRKKKILNWEEARGSSGDERPLTMRVIQWGEMSLRREGGIARDPPGTGHWGRIVTLIRIRRGSQGTPKTCPKAVHLRYSLFECCQTPNAVCPLYIWFKRVWQDISEANFSEHISENYILMHSCIFTMFGISQTNYPFNYENTSLDFLY